MIVTDLATYPQSCLCYSTNIPYLTEGIARRAWSREAHYDSTWVSSSSRSRKTELYEWWAGKWTPPQPGAGLPSPTHPLAGSSWIPETGSTWCLRLGQAGDQSSRWCQCHSGAGIRTLRPDAMEKETTAWLGQPPPLPQQKAARCH